MSLPEFKLVAAKNLDDSADIWYNDAIVRIHQVSFEEPDDPDGKLKLNIRYTIIEGDPVEDDDFLTGLGDIVWHMLEKHYG